MKKIKVLKELLQLIMEDYFEPYFEEMINKFDGYPKGLVKDFLECRIIELEESKKEETY